MGIYTNISVILGVRILSSVNNDNADYRVIHTFIGENWRECANEFLVKYAKAKNIKIQTLHNCTTTFDPTESKSTTIWMDNPDFSF